MPSKEKLDQMNAELEGLVREGNEILKALAKDLNSNDDDISRLMLRYQPWFTRALPVVKQLLPDRYDEFVAYYNRDKRKCIDYETYTIRDYLLGLRVHVGGRPAFNVGHAMFSKLTQQVLVLASAGHRLNSALSDIRGLLLADLYDSELASALGLLKSKHLRAAGTVAGVVLESHLRDIVANRGLGCTKKNPALAEYNEALKGAEVVDVPNWRWIQRLADIRNLCCHAKDREPTQDEVTELIAGVEKCVKTLF